MNQNMSKGSATKWVLRQWWWFPIVASLLAAARVMWGVDLPLWILFFVLLLAGPPWFSIRVTPSGTQITEWWGPIPIPFRRRQFRQGQWLAEPENLLAKDQSPTSIRYHASPPEEGYPVRSPDTVVAWISEQVQRLQQPGEPLT